MVPSSREEIGMKRLSVALALAFLALSGFALGHDPAHGSSPARPARVAKLKALSTDLRDGCGPVRHSLRPRKSCAMTVARG
jgi:hypothetical protein